MTDAIMRKYRPTLLTLAHRLQGEASGLVDEALRKTGGEGSGDLSSIPLHPADLGTDYSLQEVAITLLENDQQMLAQITAALARIDKGTFGTCEECGQAIPANRLEAVPYAPHCIACAQLLEIRRGNPRVQ